MKTQFNLITFMTANREYVIERYSVLSKETHFNNIALKSFMKNILNLMILNNVKSEKRATQMFKSLVSTEFNTNIVVKFENVFK